MRHFLIVYDQANGAVVRLDEYDDVERAAALDARFRLEDENRDDPNLEIVLLGAESRASLEVTHARYFKRVDELAGDA